MKTLTNLQCHKFMVRSQNYFSFFLTEKPIMKFVRNSKRCFLFFILSSSFSAEYQVDFNPLHLPLEILNLEYIQRQ